MSCYKSSKKNKVPKQRKHTKVERKAGVLNVHPGTKVTATANTATTATTAATTATKAPAVEIMTNPLNGKSYLCTGAPLARAI